MKILVTLLSLVFAVNANAATYMLLSQTNAFAAGITNEAKAYTDAHTGSGDTNWIQSPGVLNLIGVGDGSSETNIVHLATATVDGTIQIDVGGLTTGPLARTNGIARVLIGQGIISGATLPNFFSDIVAIGDAVLLSANMTYLDDVVALGDSTLSGAVLNAARIVAIGTQVGKNATIVGGQSILIGDTVATGIISDTPDLIVIGNLSAQSDNYTGKGHIAILGSNAHATNANDFVFGDTLYNYFFPGNRISLSGGGSSQVASLESDGSITTGGNTNRWILGGVTNGAPDVNVDGTHYPLAVTDSPALTGTPTINGNRISTNWVDSGSTNSDLLGNASARTFTVSMPNTNSFEILGRLNVTNFGVPSFRSAQTNRVTALDVMPNGNPAESSGNGLAWFDVCSTDVSRVTTDPPVLTARLAMTAAGPVIDSVAYGGATNKPFIIKNAGVAMITIPTNVNGSISFGDSIFVRSADVIYWDQRAGFTSGNATNVNVIKWGGGAGSLSAGSFFVQGTTNQVVFGGTNTAPVSSAAPTKWISVQVSGESTVYRLPLYE